MRVAGIFKRLLRLERVRVVGVEIVAEEDGEAVVVDLARPSGGGCAARAAGGWCGPSTTARCVAGATWICRARAAACAARSAGSRAPSAA